MILFTILTIVALLLTVTAIALLCVGGTAFIVVFGDLMVCVVFIVLILKAIVKKKKR